MHAPDKCGLDGANRGHAHHTLSDGRGEARRLRAVAMRRSPTP
jgi:hypothetical protein